MFLPSNFSLKSLFLGTLIVLVLVIFVPIVLATWSGYRSESQQLELQFHETNEQISFLAKRVLNGVLADTAQEVEALTEFTQLPLRSCRFLEQIDGENRVLASSLGPSRVGAVLTSNLPWTPLPGHPDLSVSGLLHIETPAHALLPLRKRIEGGSLLCLLDPEILHRELTSGLPSLVHRNVYVVNTSGEPLFYGRAELVRRADLFLQNPPVRLFLENGDGPLRYRSSISGRERLAFVSRLPDLGWGLVVSADIAASVLRVQDRFLGMAAALLVGAALALAVFLLFGNLLVRPLMELAAQLHETTRDRAMPLPLPRSIRRVREYRELAEGLNAHLSKLREAERQTVQAEKLATLGELTAGLAHEIGTPLNVMRGNAQLVKRRLPADDPNRAVLDKIIVQTERIADLIRNLLDIARMDRDQTEPLDLAGIVRQAWATVGSLYPQVRLELHSPNGLPRPLLRRRMVEHALMNMMVNACQAMDCMGDISVDLHTETLDGEFCIILRMKDTGSGIEAKDLPHIFKPFYSTKASGQGTGLGLALVDRVAREHGGYAFAASEVGHGAEFALVFPLKRNEETEE